MAKVAVTGDGRDDVLDPSDERESLGGQDVAPRRRRLVHHREPVAGVALKALHGGDGGGVCGGGGGRWASMPPRVSFSPLNGCQDGVILYRVGLIARSEGQDAGVELRAVLELRSRARFSGREGVCGRGELPTNTVVDNTEAGTPPLRG